MRLSELRLGLFHPRSAVVLHDLGMVALAWWLALLLRYQLAHSGGMHVSLGQFVVVLAVQGTIFAWTGLYRGLWRFASLPDLWSIARAAALGAVLVGVALFLLDRLVGVPRSVLFLYPLILAFLLGAPRLLYRYWKDSRLELFGQRAQRRVLVIGAGRSGDALVRDLRRDAEYRVVGFIDDAPQLRGARVQGAPVLGMLAQLPELARASGADMLLIAIPSASVAQMRAIVSACERTGLPFRTLPRFEDVISGRAQRNELKPVAIEDLLGRDAVSLDWERVRAGFAGRHVLISGGGGSIGSELCRQVARLGVASLTVLDSSEFNLYRIARELNVAYPDLLLRPLLGDCGDPAAARHALQISHAHVVLHAAAYKHVPLLQEQLRQAFRNNVLATRTLAAAAGAAGVATFVLVSTDKAVNPSSVMGASKRIAEMVCQAEALRAPGCHFVTVRFGNVLDSAGSVVPLFREQIARGGPVTVTHPEVTRYFMTIPEACGLILQAAVQGRSGDIFALDMGEPVRIRDLAAQMIRLSGKQPGRDIAIVYTGLRPGEKLFEELFHAQENYAPTMHAKLYLAEPRRVSTELLDAQMVRASDAVIAFDEPALRRVLQALMPGLDWVHNAQPGTVVPFLRGDSGDSA
ncbi:polysaccharide biosynthesis protein [Metallibacterium sp.]